MSTNTTSPAGVYKDACDFAKVPEDVADISLESVGGRLPTVILVKKETASIFLSVVALLKFSFCLLWPWLVDEDGGLDCSVISVFVVGGRRHGKAGRKIGGCSIHLYIWEDVDEQLA